MDDLTRLQQSAQFLRAILDNTLDAIVTIDARGIIRSFNVAGQRMFGYSEGEALGRSVNMLMPEPYASEHDGYIDRYLKTGEARIIGLGREVIARRKDGTTFPIELSVTTFSVDGQVIFTGLIRDLSAHRLLEEQLRHAQKMEAMGRLAGGIAHDFNNLLTVIGGYCEGLEATMLSTDPHLEPVRQITVAAQRAARLTNQLLAFSRKAAAEPWVLDLNQVIAETGQLLRRTIGEDISLRVDLDAKPLWVHIDPGQLTQVLLNLAVNARDAMAFGGELSIGTRRVVLEPNAAHARDLAPGPFVRVEVADTGTGMTAAVRARIFEPFFTTKGPGRGTGLGLATVYDIVRHSGGAIAVTSSPGQGTTFEVLFPEVAAPEPRRTATTTDTIPPGDETILLVEDDPDVRLVITGMLANLGYTVLAAGCAEDALEMIDAQPSLPDAVLTDVIMPGQSGRDLAEQLLTRFPALRVLFISGYTDDVIRLGVMNSAVAFIQKPFSRASLAHTLRELLDRP